MEPIKACHIFVIADACFAGSFFVPTRGGVEDSSVFTEKDSSRYALTSGRNEPVSDGRSGDNSPLAEALKFRLNTSTDSIGACMLSAQVQQDVIIAVSGYQTPRHGELNISGNCHGQFFFHKKLSHTNDADPFIDVYFGKGGDLLPPMDRSRIQEYFDEYDQYFNARSADSKDDLRRANTEMYLAGWGLNIAILKEKLQIGQILGFYHEKVDDEYTKALGQAIIDFQRYYMMRQIDGYFGELTYQQMVTALIMRGLAKYPSSQES